MWFQWIITFIWPAGHVSFNSWAKHRVCREAQRFFQPTFLHDTSFMYITNGLPLCNYNCLLNLFKYLWPRKREDEGESEQGPYEEHQSQRGLG